MCVFYINAFVFCRTWYFVCFFNVLSCCGFIRKSAVRERWRARGRALTSTPIKRACRGARCVVRPCVVACVSISRARVLCAAVFATVRRLARGEKRVETGGGVTRYRGVREDEEVAEGKGGDGDDDGSSGRGGDWEGRGRLSGGEGVERAQSGSTGEAYFFFRLFFLQRGSTSTTTRRTCVLNVDLSVFHRLAVLAMYHKRGVSPMALALADTPAHLRTITHTHTYTRENTHVRIGNTLLHDASRMQRRWSAIKKKKKTLVIDNGGQL